MIREGAFHPQKINSGCEVECSDSTHEVCRDQWLGDFRRSEDLDCDVDHGGKDDELINMATGWVENDDAKELEQEDFWPWVSCHRRVVEGKNEER